MDPAFAQISAKVVAEAAIAVAIGVAIAVGVGVGVAIAISCQRLVKKQLETRQLVYLQHYLQ